jgi:hypothetical protein
MMTHMPERLCRNAALCERDGCGTFSTEPEAHGFLMLVWGDKRYLFCKTDCLLQWLAEHSEPTIEIPNG